MVVFFLNNFFFCIFLDICFYCVRKNSNCVYLITGVEEFGSPQYQQYNDQVDSADPTADLEAKDIEQPPVQQVSSQQPIRDSEDVIPQSETKERLLPIRGSTASSLTHEEMKIMPISQQKLVIPNIKQDPIPNSNTSHEEVVNSPEVKNEVSSPKSNPAIPAINVTKSSEPANSQVVPSAPAIAMKTPESNSTAASSTTSPASSVISQNPSSSTSDASVIPDDMDFAQGEDKSLDNTGNLEQPIDDYTDTDRENMFYNQKLKR